MDFQVQDMADVSQVETSFSLEPRNAPVSSKDSSRPQNAGGNVPSESSQAVPGGHGEEAVSVDISDEAQRVSSAPPSDGGNEADSRTNQVTSFQSERAGNDTRSTTEAGRTLGQVVDTFA